MKKSIQLSLALFAFLLVWGCSTDENPITPSKMEEIRQKEADQRANFNPDMSQQKGP